MTLRNSLVAIVVVAIALTASACSGDSAGNTMATGGPSSAPTTSGEDCGVRIVGDVQVRTFCGTGTAGITSTSSSFTLEQAVCESTADFVAVNAGTIVLGVTAAAKKLRASTQYLGLTVGKIPGAARGMAASSDGTYTGGTLATNDKGKALVTNPSTLKVTLTDNRTAGTFTAKVVGGGTVKGTFSCA